jgi:hypothetical protein
LPYAPPTAPTRTNTRLFVIFGVLAAVVTASSLGALGIVLASNNGGGAKSFKSVPTAGARA